MKMPVLFVGHGSPMNAIEDNPVTRKWRELGQIIPKPKAILVVSAHWYTHGTHVNGQQIPRQIYDMYGFPEELYELVYPVQGNPGLALQILDFTKPPTISVDNDWGIDHGSWSVLNHMYPDADIPVLQLSVNRELNLIETFGLGQKLQPLREQGILLLGSGNIVHHLGRVDWEMPEQGYPWAIAFNDAVQNAIDNHDVQAIFVLAVEAQKKQQVFATWEHFMPLIYMLGAVTANDRVESFNNEYQYGSISMTGYMWTSA